MAEQQLVFTNDAVYIAQSMLEFFNTWEEKPSSFLLESLPKEGPALMVQQMAGAYKSRPFVDGSYIGAWPFAVYYRTPRAEQDTSERIKALEYLQGLFDWIKEQDLPKELKLQGGRVAQSIEMNSIPSKVAEYEDGSEDYQALFQLEYKQRRNYSCPTTANS